MLGVRARPAEFQSEFRVQKSPSRQHGQEFCALLAKKFGCESYVSKWKVPYSGAIGSEDLNQIRI